MGIGTAARQQETTSESRAHSPAAFFCVGSRGGEGSAWWCAGGCSGVCQHTAPQSAVAPAAWAAASIPAPGTVDFKSARAARPGAHAA